MENPPLKKHFNSPKNAEKRAKIIIFAQISYKIVTIFFFSTRNSKKFVLGTRQDDLHQYRQDFEILKRKVKIAAGMYKQIVFVMKTHKSFSHASEVWEPDEKIMKAQNGRITQHYVKMLKDHLAYVPGTWREWRDDQYAGGPTTRYGKRTIQDFKMNRARVARVSCCDHLHFCCGSMLRMSSRCTRCTRKCCWTRRRDTDDIRCCGPRPRDKDDKTRKKFADWMMGERVTLNHRIEWAHRYLTKANWKLKKMY